MAPCECPLPPLAHHCSARHRPSIGARLRLRIDASSVLTACSMLPLISMLLHRTYGQGIYRPCGAHVYCELVHIWGTARTIMMHDVATRANN